VSTVRSFKEEAIGHYAHVIQDIRVKQEELLSFDAHLLEACWWRVSPEGMNATTVRK
jgi:hypothetical protein